MSGELTNPTSVTIELSEQGLNTIREFAGWHGISNTNALESILHHIRSMSHVERYGQILYYIDLPPEDERGRMLKLP